MPPTFVPMTGLAQQNASTTTRQNDSHVRGGGDDEEGVLEEPVFVLAGNRGQLSTCDKLSRSKTEIAVNTTDGPLRFRLAQNDNHQIGR